MLPLLYIVIPCFNVAAVLPFSVKFYEEKLEELAFCKKISTLSKILLIDNGSTDDTWKTILDISEKVPTVSGLRLGRYSGINNALLCGFNEAGKHCDIAVAADCMCKKDINAIDRMVEEYSKGAQIVFAEREIGCVLATHFHGIFSKIKKPGRTRTDHEFFLVAKGVISELQKYTDFEIDIIKTLRNMNYCSSGIRYKRRNTFNLPKKISLKRIKEEFFSFFNAFSFPIHIMLFAGVFLTAYSLVCIAVSALLMLLGTGAESGDIFTLFIASIQLLSVGITGEYILKIMKEIKKHPKYTVVDTTETKE